MKKIISLILSVVMVFSVGTAAFGVDAFAETENTETIVMPELPQDIDVEGIMNELTFMIGSFGFERICFILC